VAKVEPEVRAVSSKRGTVMSQRTLKEEEVAEPIEMVKRAAKAYIHGIDPAPQPGVLARGER
jgi:hypothetical protein